MNEKKILWTIDIYEEDMSSQKRAFPHVKELAEKLSLPVLPVYVLSPKTLNISLSRLVEIDISTFQEPAEENMQAWQKEYSNDNFLPGKVLTVSQDSLKACTQAVSDFALNQNCEFIVTNTQGPNAIERFFLGSFAESLLVQSKVPVYSINPEVESYKKIQKVMIPTLFEPQQRPITEKYLNLAKSFSAEVVFFNVLPNLLSYATDGMYFPAPLYGGIDKTIDEEVARLNSQAQEWVGIAENLGVKAQFKLVKDHRIADEVILENAQSEGADLIAMTSQAGPVEGALLGSTARKILRASKCPVITLHS